MIGSKINTPGWEVEIVWEVQESDGKIYSLTTHSRKDETN